MNERGFASIVIALMLILILALVTVGFAQVSRREQQDALDKQLALQATDAAESGINDITQDLIANSASISNVNMDKCVTFNATGNTWSSVGPANDGVEYTCEIVNTQPNSLIASSLSPYQAWVKEFTTVGGSPNSLTISWGKPIGQTNQFFSQSVATRGFLPADSTNWGSHTGVLEVSLTPITSYDRTVLANATYSVYLYPSTQGTGVVSYAPGPAATALADGNCGSGSPPCSVTINGLGGVGTANFLIRVVAYYSASDVQLTGKIGASNVQFANAQAVIDSTGKAHNVLKRLQVRIPLNNGITETPFAVEAQNVCKRISTNPAGTKFDTSTPDSGSFTPNPCTL